MARIKEREDRGQKPETRGRKREDRNRRTETRNTESETLRLKTEGGKQKPDSSHKSLLERFPIDEKGIQHLADFLTSGRKSSVILLGHILTVESKVQPHLGFVA